MKILVLNSGSSSQKTNLYEIADAPPENPPEPLWQATVEWNTDEAEMRVSTSAGAKLTQQLKVKSREQAFDPVLDTLWSGQTKVVSSPSEIQTVGHRVVNGGPNYEHPTLITPEVRAAIARMSLFAPLHNRAELDGMDIVAKRFGPVPQVAVFDTGFHSRMPEPAFVYPGPYDWLAQGIRRYGFHGINHQYCSERTAQLLGRDLQSLKLVTCHLGNGCSLAAIQNGHSIDTTMGFTPLEGLMMGTRSGSVDPSILTYLMRQAHASPRQLDELLNKKSGLLGISGTSGDMRQIVASMKQGHARSKLAFDLFIHRLRAGIGAMVAALGGIDALIFTAGIGENSAEVRAAACANFEYLHLNLDPEKNARSPQDQDIAAPDSPVPILIIRAQEDWAIARACWHLASAKPAGRATTP
jgi:acetate kinase